MIYLSVELKLHILNMRTNLVTLIHSLNYIEETESGCSKYHMPSPTYSHRNHFRKLPNYGRNFRGMR